MYVQDLKPGDKFVWRGQVVTVKSVSLVSPRGYTDAYRVIPQSGRPLDFHAGDKLTEVP